MWQAGFSLSASTPRKAPRAQESRQPRRLLSRPWSRPYLMDWWIQTTEEPIPTFTKLRRLENTEEEFSRELFKWESMLVAAWWEKSCRCLYWMELRDPNHDRGSFTDFPFIKVSRSVELNKKIKQLASRMTLFLKPGPRGCSPKVDSGAPHLLNNWGQPKIALTS